MILRQKLIITAIIFLALSLSASAEIPYYINYQGKLTDSGGNPVNGTVDIQFAIFDDSLASSKLWKENHSDVEVVEGLFSVRLGTSSSLDQVIFDGTVRWLGMSVEGGDLMLPLTPIVSAPYAFRSELADTSAYANIANKADVCDEAERADYADDADHAIYADTADYVLSTAANGWTVNGSVIYLTNTSAKVGIGTTTPQEKLHVEGNIMLNNYSEIKFGSDDNKIENTSTDMVFHSADDIFFNPEDNMYFSHGAGSNWMVFNSLNRMVGIGTTSPEEMLNIYNDEDNGRAFLKIHAAHPSNWNEAGLRIETPQNRWHLRMDDDANNNIPDGALGLRSQDGSIEAMTWTENGFVGIGTTQPATKLHVYGSAQIKDTVIATTAVVQGNAIVTGNASISNTLLLSGDADIYGNVNIDDSLYAGAVQADLIGKENIIDEPGVASHYIYGDTYLPTTYASICSETIDVPGPGYVLAIANMSISINHDISGDSRARYGISENPNDLPIEDSYNFYIGMFADASFYGTSGSCHKLFPVSSAGSKTYHLVAKKEGEHHMYMSRKYLTLIYIPTAYGDTPATKLAGTTPALESETEIQQTGTTDMENANLADRLNKLQTEIDEIKELLNNSIE